jgi:hypothetical protein
MSEKVLGYELGEINYEAAFTSDILLDKGIDLQAMIDGQEIHRRDMDIRPGMYIKYVPGRFDSISGQFYCGGRYLFDTWENVVDYDHWTTNVFEIGNEKFWSWSAFKHVDRWNWHVIGAYNFTLPDTHAVGRFQRWTYTGENAERLLKEAYPTLKEAANIQGAGAIWVLHQPEHRMIGIHVLMDKVTGPDILAAAHASVSRLEQQPSFEPFLPSHLHVILTFDKTNLILSQWLPVSRLAGGAHSSAPNAPPFPAPTAGIKGK